MTITSMSLKTEPEVEPILWTDAALQRHLRLIESDTSERTYVEALITAARMKVEQDCGLQLITATWDFYLDRFPTSCESRRYDKYDPLRSQEIRLPKSPGGPISRFTYVGTDGTTSTLTLNTHYQIDANTTPVRVRPAYGTYWPIVKPQTLNAVIIEQVCGYGDSGADVPAPLKHAMLLLIGHWYENREAVSLGRIPSEVPMGYEALIAPYMVLEYA